MLVGSISADCFALIGWVYCLFMTITCSLSFGFIVVFTCLLLCVYVGLLTYLLVVRCVSLVFASSRLRVALGLF